MPKDDKHQYSDVQDKCNAAVYMCVCVQLRDCICQRISIISIDNVQDKFNAAAYMCVHPAQRLQLLSLQVPTCLRMPATQHRKQGTTDLELTGCLKPQIEKIADGIEW